MNENCIKIYCIIKICSRDLEYRMNEDQIRVNKSVRVNGEWDCEQGETWQYYGWREMKRISRQTKEIIYTNQLTGNFKKYQNADS